MQTALRAIVVAAAVLLGGTAVCEEATSALSCQESTIRDAGYLICSIDTKIAPPRLFWKNAEGEPYRAFADVAKGVAAEGKSLTFAMNAGMYADDFSPMGLYVEDGREFRPANTFEMKPSAKVVPNFYKKPNGVFFLDKDGPGILPTDVYLRRSGKVIFATQSGPMLVIDGKTNPIFIEGSTDRRRRSGVGVCGDGLVKFAISDGPVNFHEFARLFRDDLKCRNALFLDGGRGAGVYLPALGREDWSGHGGYGPMVGLIE